MSIIRDESLWESGETKINWVKANMPLLRGIEEEFAVSKPFAGLKVALSVHLEAKTAYLCRVMAAGGAEMYITGSNRCQHRTMLRRRLYTADLTYLRGTVLLRRNITHIRRRLSRSLPMSSSMTAATL